MSNPINTLRQDLYLLAAGKYVSTLETVKAACTIVAYHNLYYIHVVPPGPVAETAFTLKLLIGEFVGSGIVLHRNALVENFLGHLSDASHQAPTKSIDELMVTCLIGQMGMARVVGDTNSRMVTWNNFQNSFEIPNPDPVLTKLLQPDQ